MISVNAIIDYFLTVQQSQTKSKDTETSMRIFTCSIDTARKWSEMKAAKGHVMFEIFGM